ncbi:guanine deaminase [Lunatimonas lonarensis]|uniref:Guanine deaminase n=1 Tax=Lunatimonas lonarensis TaxID=1232681 RepID=R7ZW49_9BACT|nr:nucleoside deaminase [Lunatimonas lonarensis]EON78238.1 guanine deaminase [Lunatimonas lonarensis]
MSAAIALAQYGMQHGQGGPFGCVIVKDGRIVGKGYNSVLSTNDPTAHAEVMAIRDACKSLGSFQLTGCDLYTSCEPCPMCLGAIYWARPDRVFYACTKEEAAEAGFDDAFIYKELDRAPTERKIPFIPLRIEASDKPFQDWKEKENRTNY